MIALCQTVGMRCLGFCVVAGLVACGAALTPADTAEIVGVAGVIAKCQDEGRTCVATGGSDCYEVYDACMKDGGLRD